MRKARALCWLMVGFSCAATLQAQSVQPPDIAAKAYLLVDVTANQVLAAKAAEEQVDPASLTKLMSAYVVFDAIKSKRVSLRQTVPVSERAWKMTGSRMFIDPKMRVPVEDLVKGMIVQSGNDATIALAEAVGGSVEQFVMMMNAHAARLGMKSTRYQNPEGLTEPGHVTTAKDLATLAMRLMKDFPEFVPYYAIKKYRYEGTPVANENNRNLLLFRDPTVDGLKTGHTDAAGYCLVATAKRDYPNLKGRRLVSVVLGASSEIARANESQKLLNWGFTAYDAVQLFAPGATVLSPEVWKGKTDTVAIGKPEGIVVAVPSGMASQIKTSVVRPEPIVAPLQAGQALGSLRVTAPGLQVALNVPLQVLEPVELSGVMGQAWDSLRLWLR
jgi:serine-type D-Ala-D-Ala carboxypeptidase (penicillin-binding protein 5/6)